MPDSSLERINCSIGVIVLCSEDVRNSVKAF